MARELLLRPSAENGSFEIVTLMQLIKSNDFRSAPLTPIAKVDSPFRRAFIDPEHRRLEGRPPRSGVLSLLAHIAARARYPYLVEFSLHPLDGITSQDLLLC